MHNPDANCTMPQGTERDSLVSDFQQSYEAFFGLKAPEIRRSGKGGYYVRHPVRKHYEASDMRKVIRFFNRMGEG